MRRLTGESAPLLPRHVDNVVVQSRQLAKPKILNPLYSFFSIISCVSQFLPMETLLSFRLANLQLNDASEKAFLYWVSLKILRDLSKIPDQENTLNVVIPRYLCRYTLKTIDLRPELKNFISASADMNKFSGQLFLSQAVEPTVELARMQKHFLQLCGEIGSTSEDETRCSRKYLCDTIFCSVPIIMLLFLGCTLLVTAIALYTNKNMRDNIMIGTVMLALSLGSFALATFFIEIPVCRDFSKRLADVYGPQLVLSPCSAQLFKRIANTTQTAPVPINWMERLSEQTKPAGRN